LSKNNFLRHKLLSKTNIAVFCVLLALGGFLVSRAFLSLGIFLFCINALRDVHPRLWVKNKWWLLGVAWVLLYGISWFWTEDKANWSERFEVKFPILGLPLAFSFMPAFSAKQLRIITVGAALILLGSAGYTFYYFILSPAEYISGYNVAHMLPTLPEGDYIRISLTVAMFVIWCMYIWPYLRSLALKVFTAMAVAVLVTFLHVLAARTGLLVLYLFVVMYAIYVAMNRKRVLGISIIVLLIAGWLVAFEVSPTLKNKVNYFRYTYELYKNGELEGHYSDMGRLISYDIALKKIAEHPVAGTGAGDVLAEMKEGYNRWYPKVSDERRLVPHNQFMVVALACGIPGLILFVWWLLWPLAQLRRRHRGSFFFLASWLVLLVPLLTEPTLEVQYGVFVYLFFLLWQWHAMRHEPIEEV
jgi:O-antigen ligase